MPCSDKDIAKDMVTLTKSNCGTRIELAKNLALATASLEFKFGVTNGLIIRNSSGEIEDEIILATRLPTSSQTMAALCDASWYGRCGSRVDTHGQSVILYYECCYAKVRMVLGSEVRPRYLRGLA